MTPERNVEMRKRLDGRKDYVVALWITYTNVRKYSFIVMYSLLPLGVLWWLRPIHVRWTRSSDIQPGVAVLAFRIRIAIRR